MQNKKEEFWNILILEKPKFAYVYIYILEKMVRLALDLPFLSILHDLFVFLKSFAEIH